MELTSAFSHRLPEAVSEASRRTVREAAETVISLLNPMAPHLTEELWERLGGETMLVETPWPECDEDLAREEQVLVVLQVNGKLRGRLEVPAGLEREALLEQARENAGIRRHLEGLEVRRIVTVPDRLVNFVAARPS